MYPTVGRLLRTVEATDTMSRDHLEVIRLTDKPGEMVPVDPEQMTPLPPIRTALKTRSRRERGTVAVRLQGKLTEIGTLELWCSEIIGQRPPSQSA